MKKEKTKKNRLRGLQVKVFLPKMVASLRGDKLRARRETQNRDSGGKARCGLWLSFSVDAGKDI